MNCSLFLLVLASVSSAAMQSNRYVRSEDSTTENCSDQQYCLSMHEYAQQAAEFFTTGSNFIFLAGNHSIITVIHLTNVSDISFRSENGSIASILCENEVTFRLSNVTNLRIEKLAFVLFPSNRFKEPSALQIYYSKDIWMYQLKFIGNGELGRDTARAIHITRSSLTATGCLFEGNTGNDGGAIYALTGSSLTLNGNVFYRNKAKFKGGAIYAGDSIVTINGISSATLIDNELLNTDSSETLISLGIAYFSENEAHDHNGGALSTARSSVTLNGSIVLVRNNSAPNGGGIHSDHSNVTADTRHLCFIDNRAGHRGGAVYAIDSQLLLGKGMTNSNSFMRNSAKYSGGGIYFRCTHPPREFMLMGNGYFSSNWATSKGGAIYLEHAILTVASNVTSFSGNIANHAGGAIFLVFSKAALKGVEIQFQENSAEDGGALHNVDSQVITSALLLTFSANVAQKRGGGVYVATYNNASQVEISASFNNNTAGKCGGAAYVEKGKNISFKNITAVWNTQSAICVLESRVSFIGTNISANMGRIGGGIQVVSGGSFLSFSGDTLFDSNSALIGGAIYSPYETSLEFNGRTLFAHNSAETDGGALYVMSTNVSFNFNMHNVITFEHNSAENGGALFLDASAFLRFDKGIFLNTSYNHASRYGGVIYYEDTAIPTQCSFGYQDNTEIVELPYCFMRFKIYERTSYIFGTTHITRFVTGHVQSRNDSAGRDGSFVYGGLLDRCQLTVDNGGQEHVSIVPYNILEKFFEVHKLNYTTQGVTSQPYQLCFCENDKVYNCSATRNIHIHRGQKFSLFLLAIDQMKNATKTQVTAKISETARLKVNQSSQALLHHCSEVLYNLYSSEDHEQMILYPDGPCRDTGLARAVVNVILLPCPNGFDKRNEQCVCEERLKEYDANCTIDKDITISRKAGSEFWMSGLYENGTYRGLVLCKKCPLPYCSTGDLTLSIMNSDNQCANHRSGMLCGACATNYSLMLGSSRCEECSNAYLALLLPFAAAGIALVVFLSILRLTVATGMLNSVILYANIIQVNKRLLLQTEERNVLTVFIAWMNLDLGFESCFYNEMTAYAQTWLQFAFPLYVWFLISFIILASRYSITVSKLIGHNPIAVLATLLLMSYTKVLNIVIDAYSSVDLEYPGNKTLSVWLKDANVPYLQSRHLLLTVVTSLVLVFLFLPYTILLLLGYKLYRYSGRKYFRWFNKIKPLLDSYYAPYSKHTRYWTGFLLLVRCALYIVFSFNSLGAANKSLLAINITFTAMVTLAWLSVKIYKISFINVLEASIYLNLIILSTATSNGANSPALVYSLVGIVFVTMVSIIVYHFHITYTAKSAFWITATTNFSDFKKKMFKSTDTLPPMETSVQCASRDPHEAVTKTVIELREPLLEK